MPLSDVVHATDNGTPKAAGALVIIALAVLVVLNRNLRAITASVAVH